MLHWGMEEARETVANATLGNGRGRLFIMLHWGMEEGDCT